MSVYLLDVIDHVQDLVKEENYFHRIIDKLNDADLAVCSSRDPLIIIPELSTSDTVTTSTTDAFVSIPTDYLNNLHKVYSANQDSWYIDIVANKRVLEEYFDGLDNEGNILQVCVEGKNLWYQNIPTSEDTLTLYYGGKPTTFTIGVNTEITWLPDHLCKLLIGNHAAAEIIDLIITDSERSDGYRQAMSDRATNIRQKFAAAMMELHEITRKEGRAKQRQRRQRYYHNF